ncbi:hypothetical protein [Mycoplasmoides pirum]|uniref:hypothetical protein n=1 Tax=Mycoplasmoides pirum TaxID=2122 RepID=UPI000482DB84|nr:hypothetical protein [Mycoplasmoides pirum]
MQIIGFFNLTHNSDKTLSALSFANALIANGNNILFLNINLNENHKILEPFCVGNFIDFVNKKNKLMQITTRLHFFNFDLINLLNTDFEWLNKMEETYLKTIIDNFFKMIANSKKYDFVIVNMFSNSLDNLNKNLIRKLNYLICPTNASMVNQESYNLIYKIIKSENKNNLFKKIFILFTKFENFSKSTMQTIDQFKISFPLMIIDYHVPQLILKNNKKVNFLENEKSFNIWNTKTHFLFSQIVNFLKIDKNT